MGFSTFPAVALEFAHTSALPEGQPHGTFLHEGLSNTADFGLLSLHE
jgi:hypothetical protein